MLRLTKARLAPSSSECFTSQRNNQKVAAIPTHVCPFKTMQSIVRYSLNMRARKVESLSIFRPTINWPCAPTSNHSRRLQCALHTSAVLSFFFFIYFLLCTEALARLKIGITRRRHLSVVKQINVILSVDRCKALGVLASTRVSERSEASSLRQLLYIEAKGGCF